MHFVDAERTHRLLDYPGLVAALRERFRRQVDRLDRMALEQETSEEKNVLLILPAWEFGRHVGVKLVTVFPGKGPETILGVYVLFDGDTGEPLAVIDGAALTARKTAANSALAAAYLARNDAARMVMVGAGTLAPHLIMAHCAVRPIAQVKVWNRNPKRAREVAETLEVAGVTVEATTDLEAAVREADVVSCATRATEPLIRGAWLKAGAHLDLVGSFRPDMREADDDAVRRAERHYVDTHISTTAEAGDIIDPIAAGILDGDELIETSALVREEAPGRVSAEEVTFFKSGGGGHEDLGTAQYLLQKLEAEGSAAS